MKTKILLLAILSVSVSSLFAVPAVPWAVEKVQPDGTVISVYLKGDERVNWMESEDGYTLVYDSQNYVVYAKTDGQGNLTPSSIRFGIDATPPNITKGLRYSQAQVNTMRQIWKMTDDVVTQQASLVGHRKILCILAGFPDKPFTKTQADFHNLMNQVGYSGDGNSGSVRDYFYKNSYGLLDLEITVIGPVNVSRDYNYYVDMQMWGKFAEEVVNSAASLVNFSDFATNGKQVDFFHIIFADMGKEAYPNAQLIQSHRGWMDYTMKKNDVKLYQYSCSPEFRETSKIGTFSTIGVAIHEMGHGFGAPDYYDADKTDGNFLGAGTWCVMAGGAHNNNGRNPASINPYQKIKFGWLKPDTLTAGTSITNMPPIITTPVVYKIIANADNGEHYLLENRQQLSFDTYLKGHGLLIWHIAEENISGHPNKGDTLKVYPVCANCDTAIPDGTKSSYGGINDVGCPFPAYIEKDTTGEVQHIGGNIIIIEKKEFTNYSIPQAFSWATGKGIGTNIINIKENADKTVSFNTVRPVDLLIRDDANDIGTEPNPATFWGQSPDIWLTADTLNPVPILNSKLQNYSNVYVAVRVKNIGGLPSTGKEKLKIYWRDSSVLGSYWRKDWSRQPINAPQGYTLSKILQPKGEAGDTKTFFIPWTLPAYVQQYCGGFKVAWGFSFLAIIDDGNIVDGLNEYSLLTYTFAKNSNNVAFSNGTSGLFKTDYSILMELVPLDMDIYLGYNQVLKNDRYTLNNFAEVYALLSDNLIEYVDWGKCKGIKKVDENKVLLTSANSELVFKPLDNQNGKYFIGAEVNFISDKMPELNDFDFDITYKVDGAKVETMRFTAIRDEDVYFKAQAKVDKKKIVKGKENVKLTSNTIFEDATYKWYNEAENVISEDEVTLTLTPEVTQKYKVEIKREDDGFKSYDEVEVIVVDGVIKLLSPNPAQNNVTVKYLLSDNATNASIQISDVFGNVSVSTPLLTTKEEQEISLSGLVSGNYLVKLIINGAVVDAQSLIIY